MDNKPPNEPPPNQPPPVGDPPHEPPPVGADRPGESEAPESDSVESERPGSSGADAGAALGGSAKSEAQGPGETDSKRRFSWPDLRRTPDDRLIAGVAGGLGETMGVDPVIVRMGLILLTLLVGVGPVLYLAGWLLIPLGGSGSILVNALRSDSPSRLRNIGGAVLIAAGLLLTLILSRGLYRVFAEFSIALPYFAFALIVVGVALVLWPRRLDPPQATPTGPTAAATTTAAAPTPPKAGPGRPGEREPVDPQTAESGWRNRSAERRSRWAERRDRRRARRPVTLLTLAALLVLTGGAILLDRLGLERVVLGEFFAVALLVVSAGLLASVFVGRNWALILLGLVLLAPLFVFSGSDVSWWSGFGDEERMPRDAADLEHASRHGVGSLVLDLRSLDRESLRAGDGAAPDHDVRLTVGTVIIRVPADLRLRTNASIAAGEIRAGGLVRFREVTETRLFDGEPSCEVVRTRFRSDEETPVVRRRPVPCPCGPEDYGCAYGVPFESEWSWVEHDVVESGVGVDLEHSTHDDDEHDLEIDVEVGAGQVRVVRYPVRET